MARLLLPFSMGSQVYAHPDTYEPTIDHPILDIGSSYSGVKTPILEWLQEKYGDTASTGFNGDEYYIDFPTEADITLFMLRWT